MTFEDAIWIGLGLHIDSEGTVLTPKELRNEPEVAMVCPDCHAEYFAKTWEDRGSCPYCYSSNVRQVRA